jgi:ferrous iron transport protein A
MTYSNEIPLSLIRPGEIVRLSSIKGCENVQNRLTAMGFTPGVELEVVQDQGGPLMIAVRDSRVALGRGLANKILVEIISEKTYEREYLEDEREKDYPHRFGWQSQRWQEHHFQRPHGFKAARGKLARQNRREKRR